MPFELVSTEEGVDLWCDERLAFEPHGELLEMREAVKAELRNLSGAGMSAWLAGPRIFGFDVENVLFYNVGWSAFTGCCRDFLRFERRFTVSAAPSGRIWKWHHHYRLAQEEGAWRPSPQGTEFQLRGEGSLPGSPAALWAAAHRGRSAHVAVPPARPLFLRLHVKTPRAVNLAQVVKPLVDGVCCSLHSYVGALLPEVALRAADVSGEDEPTVLRWLARSGPLGPARFVWPYGSRLQWSPDDDRIVALELTGEQTGRPGWSVDAALYEALPR